MSAQIQKVLLAVEVGIDPHAWIQAYETDYAQRDLREAIVWGVTEEVEDQTADGVDADDMLIALIVEDTEYVRGTDASPVDTLRYRVEAQIGPGPWAKGFGLASEAQARDDAYKRIVHSITDTLERHDSFEEGEIIVWVEIKDAAEVTE